MHKAPHIEAKYHFIQEQVLASKIHLNYVPTDNNPLDILTKLLVTQKIGKHCSFIRLRSLASITS